MLVFNLKKQWFEKIKRGEKTHEYRIAKPYWTKRFVLNEALSKEKELYCFFAKGYPKRNEKGKWLEARILSVKVINGKDTDLKIDNDVYDIEFELIKEREQNDRI